MLWFSSGRIFILTEKANCVQGIGHISDLFLSSVWDVMSVKKEDSLVSTCRTLHKENYGIDCELYNGASNLNASKWVIQKPWHSDIVSCEPLKMLMQSF